MYDANKIVIIIYNITNIKVLTRLDNSLSVARRCLKQSKIKLAVS